MATRAGGRAFKFGRLPLAILAVEIELLSVWNQSRRTLCLSSRRQSRSGMPFPFQKKIHSSILLTLYKSVKLEGAWRWQPMGLLL